MPKFSREFDLFYLFSLDSSSCKVYTAWTTVASFDSGIGTITLYYEFCLAIDIL